MPTFDFACGCGFAKTDIDSMISKRVHLCPKCGQETLIRLIGSGSGFVVSTGLKDKAGQSITFKEPYFDAAFRRTFKSAKEKADFMNKNGMVEAGDSDVKVKKERKEHHEKKNDLKKEKRHGK